MAVDYKRYLAENVLNERRIVTYRLLSRALKVHCNLAKQMLYDFHRTENAKRPKSVFATYLISGVQAVQGKPVENGVSKDGDDTFMKSSLYMSSMPQPDETEKVTRVTTFVLAREEDLEGAKASFQSISMIHIYSLQSNTLQDLNALLDVSREILSSYGHEDPLELGKHWGMIQNEHVKRRKAMKPPPPAAVPAVPKPSVSTAHVPKKDKPSQKNESGQGIASKQAQQKSQEKTEKSQAQQKKGDLFSSFAKAKSKPKKEESAASGAESVDKNNIQNGMFDDDDAEDEEDGDIFANSGESKITSTRESRKEREAKLKKMMEDDDDEDMPDVSNDSAVEESEAVEPEEEPEPEPEPEEPKEEVIVSNGRRRGKRKVMKKKTKKDDEGYLVTVEEPVWESFSEDEPAAPPKKKPAISTNATKGKKPGQGNIMSFFSKK